MTGSSIWHPFTQHGLGEPIPHIKRAKGACLFTKQGRQIVDAISSWWVTTHGHCEPTIMAAIAAQAEHLDQIIFAGWTHEPAERVARGLLRMLQAPLSRVFFSDSGSTSVEVAIKMALGYWLNRGDARHRLIVLEHGYHGDTVGAMSIGHRGVFNRAYEPLLFEVTSVPFPSEDRRQETLDALEETCRRSGAAAFIVEPLILGAGGMHIYSPEILSEMKAICARYGVIFIADEVMTGWGRTGTFLACEQANVVPDILCLSKGLTGGSMPLAVTVASEDIYQAHYCADRSKMLFHSSSYTANPIACAAAAANIDIWRREPVIARIGALAERQEARLAALKQYQRIFNPRRIGTIVAFEIGHESSAYLASAGPKLLKHFRSRDILLRPLGNTVYVMPPYCITDDQLDAIYSAIVDAL